MNATASLPVVGIDLAKSVFQIAIADGSWRVVEQQRLTRSTVKGKRNFIVRGARIEFNHHGLRHKRNDRYFGIRPENARVASKDSQTVTTWNSVPLATSRGVEHLPAQTQRATRV